MIIERKVYDGGGGLVFRGDGMRVVKIDSF